MPAYSKVLLSGSTSGKQIKVAATATPGTALHTAVSGSASFDELWLWANSQHTGDVILTIELGGVTAPDNNVTLTIPAKVGPILVIPGWPVNGAVDIKAFADVANVVLIAGYVNRIA